MILTIIILVVAGIGGYLFITQESVVPLNEEVEGTPEKIEDKSDLPAVHIRERSETNLEEIDEYPTSLTEHKDYKQTVSSKLIYNNSEKDITKYFFNKDSKDNVYVATSLNEIKIFDKEGNFKSVIQPKGSTGDKPIMLIGEKVFNVGVGDFVFDANNNLYMLADLSSGRNIIQYNPNYELSYVNKIAMKDLSGVSLLVDMYIIGNNIYVLDSDQNSHLVGVVENEVLKETQSMELQGILGSTSGNLYKVELLEGFKKGRINISNSSNEIIKVVNLEKDGIITIVFLGEDKTGNFYIQTERTLSSGQSGINIINRAEASSLVLEVSKFDSAGNLLVTTIIPNNSYRVWSNKLLLIDKDGNIWQVIGASDEWQINKWSTLY